ncbi:uncharacterized protein TNIN_132821 [Trichonephila inaurata madagascariensis]|uniref:C2H2-type domain-containing protein n=1 Tax=Trichonephila inaurata madagascariensis TaxID=2747483 RepID=A0A8X7C4Y3_9ARAC|nr:uncharacterized protein TNIN_132821 [Trichonephila inaurata madagascariensis]
MSCYDWPINWKPDYSYWNTHSQIEMPSIPDDQDPILISRAVLESIKIEMSDDDYLYSQSNHLLPNQPDVSSIWTNNSVPNESSPMPHSNSSFQTTAPTDHFSNIKMEYESEPSFTELGTINSSFEEYYLRQNNMYFTQQRDVDNINTSVELLFDKGNLNKLLQTSPEELLNNANIDDLVSGFSVSDRQYNTQDNKMNSAIPVNQSNSTKRNYNRKHYKCSHCTHSTNSKEYLTEHISRIHPMDSSYKNKIRSHWEKFHIERAGHKNLVLRQRPPAAKSNPKCYKCSKCSYKSIRIDRFQKHLEKKNCRGPSYEYDIQPRYFRKARAGKENCCPRRSTNYSKTRPYKCSLCPYTSLRTDRMQKHVVKMHSKNVCYRCNVCSFESTFNREYYEHMKKHYKGPPYVCESCSYKSKLITAFIAHRVTHTGDRLFNCTLCSFNCKRKYHLKGHMISHSKEKNFVCMHCTKRYSYKCSLVRHLKTSCKGGTRCL